MKIRAVKSNKVQPVPGGFAYSISYQQVNGWSLWCSPDTFPTEDAAKQAMREKVAHERKRHGLEG